MATETTTSVEVVTSQDTVNPEDESPDAPLIRVLLVIDHLILAEGIRQLLDTCTDLVVVGVFGAIGNAVAAMDHLEPDVVLMAYQLPDGDGVAAVATLKHDHPGMQAVILAGTEDDERFVRRAFEAGCSGWVGKARSAEDLRTAVRSAHAGQVLISNSVLLQLVPRKTSPKQPLGAALSQRECEVLAIIAEGGSDRQTALRLSVSHNTARKHTQNIIRKLGAHSKLEAVIIAIRNGLIPPL